MAFFPDKDVERRQGDLGRVLARSAAFPLGLTRAGHVVLVLAILAIIVAAVILLVVVVLYAVVVSDGGSDATVGGRAGGGESLFRNDYGARQLIL